MMFKLSNATRTAVSAIALSFAASAMPVVAQAQEAAAPSEPRWFKTCAKQEESDVCVVQNQLVAANGQLITAVGLITVEGKVNRKLLQVTVPSARLIPPGVMMQIDGAKGTKLDYAVCLPDRCTAEIPLTDAIIDSLKKGGEVVFTSINFRRAPNPIKIPLSGFTGAFDGEAMSQSQAEERQRLLQEAMQKKQEERNKAITDAQNAAKQGN
ncbi:MAG: invasion associated locus B family protein [Alphaproteobacteria bacterium]|uniref:invasion associated locus B family protein n=1 Tax=Rhizobium/Agrobacterium group TaxID=227290 RepID=UPI0006B881E8|nr:MULTISPECIES: invasion associated locus B family protein [Rhizobium/Agrobacterium group]MBU0739275.1 invasion associated locus B family protein [Alphaproteobacteria bacterium]MDM7980151.1 invasion associated locus B family protein [Rhizobium sp.]AOG10152.1 invasion associated locus B family protein [Agrobacterium sp. RAC06]KPF59047.1 Invasion associated locus B family protein [Rhizobium sp. AAP116]MBU0832280.1 invasion associated locus B family protein [Alphaproteobacteria bacterium]